MRSAERRVNGELGMRNAEREKASSRKGFPRVLRGAEPLERGVRNGERGREEQVVVIVGRR